MGMYHNFIAGGVIVQFITDKREYWNYDIYNSSLVVNFDSIESLEGSIVHMQNQSKFMAQETKYLTCNRLQIRQIELYWQEFFDEYGGHGHVQLHHNRTYHLETYGPWRPTLIHAATVLGI